MNEHELKNRIKQGIKEPSHDFVPQLMEQIQVLEMQKQKRKKKLQLLYSISAVLALLSVFVYLPSNIYQQISGILNYYIIPLVGLLFFFYEYYQFTDIKKLEANQS